MNTISKCKSCGQEIFWIKTPTGSRMPVNFNRRLTVITSDGKTVRGWEPHWATCTDTNKFRRKP